MAEMLFAQSASKENTIFRWKLEDTMTRFAFIALTIFSAECQNSTIFAGTPTDGACGLGA